MTHNYSHLLAESVANELLSEPAGAKALKSLHRFLCYNVDWVHSLAAGEDSAAASAQTDKTLEDDEEEEDVNGVGTDVLNVIPVLIKPWGSEIHPPQNPYEMMNQIGGYLCDNGAPPGRFRNSNDTGSLSNGNVSHVNNGVGCLIAVPLVAGSGTSGVAVNGRREGVVLGGGGLMMNDNNRNPGGSRSLFPLLAA